MSRCAVLEVNYEEDVADRINSVLYGSGIKVVPNQCRRVRNVAPKKDMICAQFYIQATDLKAEIIELQSKRPKLNTWYSFLIILFKVQPVHNGKYWTTTNASSRAMKVYINF